MHPNNLEVLRRAARPGPWTLDVEPRDCASSHQMLEPHIYCLNGVEIGTLLQLVGELLAERDALKAKVVSIKKRALIEALQRELAKCE